MNESSTSIDIFKGFHIQIKENNLRQIESHLFWLHSTVAVLISTVTLYKWNNNVDIRILWRQKENSEIIPNIFPGKRG